MKKNDKNRMSVITVAILVVIAVVVAIVCLKLFVIKDSNNNKNKTINKSNEISAIEGETYVEYEGNAKVNISEYLKEEKYLGEFIFSNFRVYCIDGVTRVEYEVSNESEKRQTLESFKFVIYGEEQKAGTITCYGDEFAAGQTKKLNVTIDCDVSNMSDILVEEVYSNVM